MVENNVGIVVYCNNCGQVQSPVRLKHSQLKAWVNGQHIQNAMPHLSAAERELLISGTCDNCFNQMFGV